jgi:anaerobic dimethyl sulfoxide reductase subunit C (anchor subunit)
LVLFSILAGGGAATLAFAGISEFLEVQKKTRLIASIAAIVLLVVGGIASVLHLGQPANVMAAAANIFSFSPISLELLLLGVTTVAAIVYAVVVNGEGPASKVVGVIGLVVAVVFCYALGSSYSGIEAQTSWNSLTLVLAYWASAVAFGGFVFLAAMAAGKETGPATRPLSLIVFLVAILQVVGFVAYGLFVGLDNLDALVFWGCAVVLGSIVPLVAVGAVAFMKSVEKPKTALLYVGLVTAFVGGIAIRTLMWAAGNGFLDAFDMALQNRGLFIF